mmetsp:Transcript_13233/g.26882  ORF Transcript_13233/g.26882 Transcript_13233/m.26882 type:complete len:91 (-) Transcript_13233:2788-3060(-)
MSSRNSSSLAFELRLVPLLLRTKSIGLPCSPRPAVGKSCAESYARLHITGLLSIETSSVIPPPSPILALLTLFLQTTSINQPKNRNARKG